MPNEFKRRNSEVFLEYFKILPQNWFVLEYELELLPTTTQHIMENDIKMK